MSVEQEDIDLALTTFLASVIGNIVSCGYKASEAFQNIRRVLEEIEEEAKKDPAYE